MVFYSIKLKKNICGRTSLYFDETMFRNIKPDEQWIIDKCLGYIQNILNYNTKSKKSFF